MNGFSARVAVEAVVARGSDYWIFRGTDVAAPGPAIRFVADDAAMARPPVEGETWRLIGVRTNDRRYGPQIEVGSALLERPSGRLIVHLLAGRAFPDVGRKTAQSLWDAYGETLYQHLDGQDTGALLAVLGENQRTLRQVETILSGWREARLEPAICGWLDRNGFPPRLARKVMDCYGDETVAKLEENPYRLAAFTSPWRAVDDAARAMGVAATDARRLVSAVETALYAAYDSGHTLVSDDVLRKAVRDLLARPDQVDGALRQAVEERAAERAACGWQALGPVAMERTVANRLYRILSGKDSVGLTRPLLHGEFDGRVLADVIAAFEAEEGYALNARQQEAVHMACTARLCLLTGGAGVGKTSVLKAVLAAARRMGWMTRLMALSGRAALRMTEATGHGATTIRRFLKTVQEGGDSLDDEPLVVIDECSMVDLPLMFELLQWLPPGCRLLLVGDDGQLPPIGPGLVFHALVQDETIPKVTLTETMRQAAETGIPAVAATIREGRVPNIGDYRESPDAGVAFMECDQGALVETVLDLMGALGGIGAAQVVGSVKGGLDPLVPGYKPGTRAVNAAFHRLALMGREDRVLFGRFLPGEPVVWLRNDRRIGLMNGEIGIVLRKGEMENPEYARAAAENRKAHGIEQCIASLVIDVGGREVHVPEYDVKDPRRIQHAYAVTTHKAQGSQALKVVIPVTPSRIMDRTMLYTAVTRAKEKVVLVGDRAVFERAVVDPPSYSLRATGMRNALRAAARRIDEREFVTHAR